jgi:hypothetical protein
LKVWNLKIIGFGPLQWHKPPHKYLEDLPRGSKFIWGGGGQTDTQTDKQTGDLISLLSFLKVG